MQSSLIKRIRYGKLYRFQQHGLVFEMHVVLLIQASEMRTHGLILLESLMIIFQDGCLIVRPPASIGKCKGK